MTASHSPRVRGLTPLFSVLSPASGSARSAVVDDVAELVDADGPVDVAELVDTATVPPDAAASAAPSTPGAAAMTPAPADDAPDEAPTGNAAHDDAVHAIADGAAVAAERPVPAVRAAHDLVVPVTDDGVPLSLDVFAVTARAVLVLIGASGPAEQIAKTAIGLSIESEHSAAFDIVVPRAIDLVLYRAKALVSAGIAPDVVESYEERLELWRRLALRSGLEPAAIVLSMAPFPNRMIASMLRVALDDVDAVIERWSAGIDPDPTDADAFTMRPAQIATSSTATSGAGTAGAAPDTAGTGRAANPAASAETVGATAYAAASAAASAPMTTPGRAESESARDHQSELVAMNEDALNAFLGLPEGKGSRLRQVWRRLTR